MWDISKMIIIPICAGLIFNKLLSGKSKWLDDAMPLVYMFGNSLHPRYHFTKRNGKKLQQ